MSCRVKALWIAVHANASLHPHSDIFILLAVERQTLFCTWVFLFVVAKNMVLFGMVVPDAFPTFLRAFLFSHNSAYEYECRQGRASLLV